jgi:hypothetical protein
MSLGLIKTNQAWGQIKAVPDLSVNRLPEVAGLLGLPEYETDL